MIGIDVPTRDEMAEIEDPAGSTRRGALHDGDAAGQGRDRPSGVGAGHLHPVGKRLVTVRYEATRAFETFP